MKIRVITICAALVLLFELAVAPVFALSLVPPGNRSAKQPAIPYGAVSRTRATNGSFQGKYEKIRDLLGLMIANLSGR